MPTHDESAQKQSSATQKGKPDGKPIGEPVALESKSQRLKRVPPFLKSIAEINLEDDKASAEPKAVTPEGDGRASSDKSASLLSAALPEIEDVKAADKIAEIPAIEDEASKIEERAQEKVVSNKNASSTAGEFSRYTKRYTEGNARSNVKASGVQGVLESLKHQTAVQALSSIDPVGSWIPSIVYGGLGIAATVVWFVVAAVTSQGSVMTNPPAFNAGIAILILFLVIGVLFAAAMSVLGLRQWNGTHSVDVVVSVLGRTAAAMAAFVLVWSILMLIAA